MDQSASSDSSGQHRLRMSSAVTTLEYDPLPYLDDNYAWLITDGMHADVVEPGIPQPVIDYFDTAGCV